MDAALGVVIWSYLTEPDDEMFRVEAAQDGDLAEVVNILEAPLDPDSVVGGASMVTPLIAAVKNGHEEVVRVLLQAGADKHSSGGISITPMHVAAENGHQEVVRVLLQASADVRVIDCAGQTPLHVAAMEGHQEVARCLLKAGAGADKHNFDNDGRTPLECAGLTSTIF